MKRLLYVVAVLVVAGALAYAFIGVLESWDASALHAGARVITT